MIVTMMRMKAVAATTLIITIVESEEGAAISVFKLFVMLVTLFMVVVDDSLEELSVVSVVGGGVVVDGGVVGGVVVGGGVVGGGVVGGGVVGGGVVGGGVVEYLLGGGVMMVSDEQVETLIQKVTSAKCIQLEVEGRLNNKVRNGRIELTV